MRRTVWLKAVLIFNACLLVYMGFSALGLGKGFALFDGSSGLDGPVGSGEKNVLRHFLNVVHSIDDNRSRQALSSEHSSPKPDAKPLTPILCQNRDLRPREGQRGEKYWAYYNYIQADKKFGCNESITYTTHGEYTFLHNLEPLLQRWQGPVSISVFTPGTDYGDALQAIYYYRNCQNSTLVKDFVTFHIYFPLSHMPKNTWLLKHEGSKLKGNCNVIPAVIEDNNVSTYRQAKAIDYPVNVGRNIARESANTHFIFPSDVELYPNPGLIPDFLDMIQRNEHPLDSPRPRVFVSSIFEIKNEGYSLPNTKKELVDLLNQKIVIPFHKVVCSQCHSIPKADDWRKLPVSEKMHIFHVAKRVPPYSHWEPIYIGTHDDPLYDERLSWEGRSDKMTQGYQLCVLDYDFMILDNAFLIHRPGIKTQVSSNTNKTLKKKVAAQNELIHKVVMPELRTLYGSRKGCEK